MPTAEITIDGIEPRHVVLYFHGGVYVLGDAFQAAGLASQVGRRTRAKVISVDYRLAPEHPYPARSTMLLPPTKPSWPTAQPLRTSPSRESPPAVGCPSPPWSTPAITGCPGRRSLRHVPVCRPHPGRDNHGNQARGHPLLSRENLQSRIADYTAGQDATLGLISPIFADLSGLPPLIIQAGSHEVLLDDAVRLARQAATADVEITLDITPQVPHVFQAYYPILDEAAAALDRAGQLLSAHFAGAERVTA